MNEVNVSVVIPTRNREAVLPECLRRLLAEPEPPDEIIVVDASSSEATQEILAQFPSIVNQRLGDVPNSSGIGRNVGISLAHGEIVAFIDDDSFIRPGWLGELLRAFEDPGVKAAGGRVIENPWRLPAHNELVALLDFEKDLICGEWDANGDQFIDVPHLPGGNCAVRREVALAVGGFDTNFVGSANLEETDFFYRVSKTGGRIVFVPTAVVEHRAAPRPDSIVRSFSNYIFRFSMVRNRLYFLRKHGELKSIALRRQCVDMVVGAGKYLLYAGIFTLASAHGILAGLLAKPVGRSEGLEKEL